MNDTIKGKKILIYISDLKVGNGISTCIMNYYECLVKRGAIVHFLLNSGEASDFTRKVLDAGSKIFSFPINTSKPKKKNIDFIRLIMSTEYDIVHVNSSGFYALAILQIAKKNKIKVRIYHAHNPKERRSAKVILREMLYVNPSIRKANFYAACSRNAGDSVYNHQNYVVINNAMNIDKFKYVQSFREEIQDELGLKDKFVVGVVGRIEAQKNPYRIIDIFEEFHKLKSNAILIWAGDGTLKNSIVQYVKNKKIEDYVVFLGVRKDVNMLYSAMDIFLLPSIFEGLGLVFFEAQISGLLCFGSDKVPKDVEVTNNMNFYSLSWSNEQWATKILNEIENLPNRNNAYFEVENSKFDITKMSNSLADYYVQCLNQY